MGIALRVLRVSQLVMAMCCWWAAAARGDVRSDVGEVSFVNSGAKAAQPEFLRALAQLHNFEYEDAALHFRRAEEIDPSFVMAYWGEAMTKNHGIWHQQDLRAAREVLARLGSTPQARLSKAPTEREKQYLASVEILYGDGSKGERDEKYKLAMEQLYKKYPDDVDAGALYALAILGSAQNGRDVPLYMQAAAVLEEIFPQHTRHPGVVHYLIHSYDDPIHAPLGLRAARIYAQLAPEAGHAQHMTSHIFLALGMWDDVVKANEIAIGVVNRQREAAKKSTRFCGHYDYWLEYGYLQKGRIDDARRMVAGCYGQAKQEIADGGGSATGDPDSNAVGSFAEMRATFLINSQLWKDDVIGWTLQAINNPFAQLTLDYADALSAYETSRMDEAREALARMEADAKAAVGGAGYRSADERSALNRANVLVEQVRALLTSGDGESIRELQRVAEKENSMPVEFGPPFIYKPTDELLGEIYLQLHRAEDARRSFSTVLAHDPGRQLGVRGLAAAESGRNRNESTTTAPAAEIKGDHIH